MWSPRIKSDAPGTPTYRVHTWTAVCLLLGYTLYVYKEYQDLHRLNQHELALAAREIGFIIRNSIDTVNKAGDLCGFDQDQPYLQIAPPGNCLDFAGGEVDKKAQVEVNGGLAVTTKVTFRNKPPLNAKFTVLLDVIVAELAPPDLFRLVFVAQKEGEIIHQEAPRSRLWRSRLSWHEQTFRERTPGEGEGVTITNLGSLFDDSEKPSFEQITSGGSRFGISLGGQWEEVYMQPILIGETKLLIGGLVPKWELLQRALHVETYAVTALVFVFFAVLFGFPFLKLYFLDRRERFRLLDAFLLYLGSGALLVLFIFAVLALDGYLRFGEMADRGLEQMSRELSQRLAAEAGQSVKFLTDSNKAASTVLPACHEKKPPFLNWLTAKEPPLRPPFAEQKVWVDLIAWANADGQQIFKLSADQAGKNQLVRPRVYFQAIYHKSLFQAEDGTPFFFGPQRSTTDGKFYTFVAVEGKCRARTGPDGRTVVVLGVHSLSLGRQALPAGYGFALINREGAVLYHSDPRLSLRENLYAELGSSGAIKSLVMAGERDFMSESYRERPQRFYVAPFNGFKPAERSRASHLFLVTFRDASAEMTTVAFVFLSSLMLLPGLLLVWIAAAMVIDLNSRLRSESRRGGTWIWPRRSMDRLYRWQTFAQSGWLVIAIAGWIKGYGTTVFLIGPLIVALIGIVNFQITQSSGPRARSEAPWCRRTAWALSILLVVIAPAIAIFRLMLSHEFGKLVETERVWMEQQSSDAGNAILKETRDENRPEWEGERIKAIRERDYQLPAPAPFDKAAPKISSSLQLEAVRLAERWGGGYRFSARPEHGSGNRISELSILPPV
jgi:hypothetical protein